MPLLVLDSGTNETFHPTKDVLKQTAYQNAYFIDNPIFEQH